jgi:choline dehydrogenase-like flavoprotein
MHIDLDEVAAPRAFRSTVCIIGGGIAGLILATRLGRQGVEVCLLEAGGLLFEERSQAFYGAEMGGSRHRGSNEGRFRTFGGSSTRWGGQILPFTGDIFDPPEGSGSVPWAITEEDISPYYEEAQEILGANSLSFSSDFLSSIGRKSFPGSEDICVRFSKRAPFNKRNLAKTAGAEALAHPRVTVVTHANAAQLVASQDNSGRIQCVRAMNYGRVEFTFLADFFVVCAGTVESSRLLLCSPGVPDPHDQIGRYFHDHTAFHAARFVSPGRERVLEKLGPFYVKGTIHTCKFEASTALRTREGLLPAVAYTTFEEPEESGALAFRNLLRSLQGGRLQGGVITSLAPVIRGAGDVGRLFFYSQFLRRRAVSKLATIRIQIDVQQAPCAESQIRLSDTKRDALGLPTTIVDWKINDPEVSTAVRYAEILRAYLQKAGLDPGDWNPCLADGTKPVLEDTNHAMGGLRMGTDARSSVVDQDLAVHGLDNLYVASCAVFPSGSSSNPTFTMMALTLRLADHLARRMPRGAAVELAEAANPLRR